jgi:hypothetical protein
MQTRSPFVEMNKTHLRFPLCGECHMTSIILFHMVANSATLSISNISQRRRDPMQRILLTGIMVFLACGITAARDFPKAEIFCGYSVMAARGSYIDNLLGAATLDAPTGTATSKWFKKGFDASFAYNVYPYFGIEAGFQYNANDVMEFTGNVAQHSGDKAGSAYHTYLDTNVLSFMAGPKLAYRKNKQITPYAHVLFGITRVQVTPSLTIDGQNYTGEFTNETGIGKISDVGFGLAAGGGIDIKAHKNIAIRPIQLDYLMGRHLYYGDSSVLHNVKFSFGVVVRLDGE